MPNSGYLIAASPYGLAALEFTTSKGLWVGSGGKGAEPHRSSKSPLDRGGGMLYLSNSVIVYLRFLSFCCEWFGRLNRVYWKRLLISSLNMTEVRACEGRRTPGRDNCQETQSRLASRTARSGRVFPLRTWDICPDGLTAQMSASPGARRELRWRQICGKGKRLNLFL